MYTFAIRPVVVIVFVISGFFFISFIYIVRRHRFLNLIKALQIGADRTDNPSIKLI